MLPILFAWSGHEMWIMLIASLVCSSCGLLGCFLVLKRQALMADAISHAVLPGIVLAVMLTGKLNSIWVIIGAAFLGILTPLLSDVLRSSNTLKEDSAMGIVFTSLFALGVVLISQASNIDLDPDCVLYGEIAIAPFDVWIVDSKPWLVSLIRALPFSFFAIDSITNTISLGPVSFWLLAGVFLVNLFFIILFYKEFKLTTFDPSLAHAMGFSPRIMHYLLMVLVTITTVASFEAVGAILVVAMFVAPAATAYLCTDHLSVMLILSVVFGIASAILGYISTQVFGGDISIAGAMSVITGILFGIVLIVSPNYGLLLRWKRKKIVE